MTPSKRPQRRPEQETVRSDRFSRRPKIATVRLYRQHAEMVMAGFEVEDLEVLKDSVPMRWDRYEKCWLIHWRDIDELLETLDETGFAVRLKEAG